MRADHDLSFADSHLALSHSLEALFDDKNLVGGGDLHDKLGREVALVVFLIAAVPPRVVFGVFDGDDLAGSKEHVVFLSG